MIRLIPWSYRSKDFKVVRALYNGRFVTPSSLVCTEIDEAERISNGSQRSCSGGAKCDHTILPFANYEVRRTCKESSFHDIPGVGPACPSGASGIFPLPFERGLESPP
jgi:hypothetical protein